MSALETYRHVVGHEQLVSLFGYWPSFHDGDVVWFRLDRHATLLGPGCTLDIVVHGFQMTDETDAKGYFVLRNHVLAHFRFAGVFSFRCDSFYPKHELSEVVIQQTVSKEPDELQFEVLFGSVYGSEGISFKCSRMELVNVRPSAAEDQKAEDD